MTGSQNVTYAFPEEPSGLSDLDQYDWAECIRFRNLDGTETTPSKKAALYNDYDSILRMRVAYPSAYTLGWVNTKNISRWFF